jgi:hypothetical protein
VFFTVYYSFIPFGRILSENLLRAFYMSRGSNNPANTSGASTGYYTANFLRSKINRSFFEPTIPLSAPIQLERATLDPFSRRRTHPTLAGVGHRKQSESASAQVTPARVVSAEEIDLAVKSISPEFPALKQQVPLTPPTSSKPRESKNAKQKRLAAERATKAASDQAVKHKIEQDKKLADSNKKRQELIDLESQRIASVPKETVKSTNIALTKSLIAEKKKKEEADKNRLAQEAWSAAVAKSKKEDAKNDEKRRRELIKRHHKTDEEIKELDDLSARASGSSYSHRPRRSSSRSKSESRSRSKSRRRSSNKSIKMSDKEPASPSFSPGKPFIDQPPYPVNVADDLNLSIDSSDAPEYDAEAMPEHPYTESEEDEESTEQQLIDKQDAQQIQSGSCAESDDQGEGILVIDLDQEPDWEDQPKILIPSILGGRIIAIEAEKEKVIESISKELSKLTDSNVTRPFVPPSESGNSFSSPFMSPDALVDAEKRSSLSATSSPSKLKQPSKGQPVQLSGKTVSPSTGSSSNFRILSTLARQNAAEVAVSTETGVSESDSFKILLNSLAMEQRFYSTSNRSLSNVRSSYPHTSSDRVISAVDHLMRNDSIITLDTSHYAESE